MLFREGTDPKKVQNAHRNIIKRNHPDRGGSPFIATKINEAKARVHIFSS
jgi:DnaJ family protein C protein 19